MKESALAGKSEIYKLCRRVEKAESRRRLRARLGDFTDYLTWLTRRSKTTILQRVAYPTDEEPAPLCHNGLAGRTVNTTGQIPMTALEIEKRQDQADLNSPMPIIPPA